MFGRVLVESGAGLQIEDQEAVITAAAVGQLQILRSLLDAGGALETIARNGFTPALIAAKNGHLEVLQFLAGAGADLCKATDLGNTALILASRNGHLDTVRFLLGADPDLGGAKHLEVNAAFCFAASHGHLEV